MRKESNAESRENGETGGRSLWLWVAGGFLLLALAWGAMFTVARATKVESVPLVTKETRS